LVLFLDLIEDYTIYKNVTKIYGTEAPRRKEK
jgi:hypothetical protein